MRDYNATLGRYIQADPLVDGASVYRYALQNPARWSDPRGEFVFPDENPAAVQADIPHIGGGGSGGPAWSPIAGLGALLLEMIKLDSGSDDVSPQQCSPSQTNPWCVDDWEDEQAQCSARYGICKQIAGTNRYLLKRCARELGACLENAKENFLKCVGR